MHEALARATGLSDAELLARVARLASHEREATVELVAHLAEVDARKLHLTEGYGSLFAYCTGALRLAEHAAFNRIEAARLVRRFPAVLDLLADGALNLSTARRLAPHLRPDNFDRVVAQARGRSKREVEALVARLAPRPDVPASVRRLPTSSLQASTADETPAAAAAPIVAVPGAEVAVVVVPLVAVPVVAVPVVAVPVAVLPVPTVPSPDATISRPVARAEVTPLAPERHRVQFTIDAATRDKLGRVQDLLRREIPNGDPGAIFVRALDLLLADVSRRKLAAVKQPRPQSDTGGRGRHIPAPVKRAVWVRDEGRCAFVSAKGRRCAERAFLEFHHREPYAMGGVATVANIALRCHAHNAYEGEVDFGGRGSNSSRDEFPPSRLSKPSLRNLTPAETGTARALGP